MLVNDLAILGPGYLEVRYSFCSPEIYQSHHRKNLFTGCSQVVIRIKTHSQVVIRIKTA